ncbi:serine hydrolase FSH [Podospora australis]|uniref:Serine hydrolase FSH n=1 Tax=Podospora australis TaxID=1536484 RepID=A0AAN6WK81_9PEZI|nr:serine hydrolase FSH [Podospora australis]
MRFLCLHGIGTNSQIFKMQTAAFRYELADNHKYEFVQGTVPWELPQELASLSDPSKTHYAYFDMTSNSFIAALDNLEAYIESEGPFDGVVGYSQGAGLAAMLMVRRSILRAHHVPLFRCAVFFSPVQVYDPVAYLEQGEVQVLGGKTVISVPVAVVYGEKDDRKEECRSMQSICDPEKLSVFVHEGGHEIPGLGGTAKSGVLDSVKVARQAITRAELDISLHC